MGNRGRPRGASEEEIPLPTGTRPTSRRSLPTRAERRKLARKVKRRRRRSAAKEIPLLILVALLIALVLKTFLVQAFVIPSGSMEQTIQIGDRVLVDKLTPWFGSKAERGDVVVFNNPSDWTPPVTVQEEESPVVVKQVKQALTAVGLLPSDDEHDLIKRVIAIGGDTVKCCDEDGRITVNGVPLDEPYLYPGNPPSTLEFEVKVPAGRIFVMGDHRSNSADSRFHLDKTANGTVSEDAVVGRAVVIAWPIGHWRKLEEPDTYASVPNARAGTTEASTPSRSLSSQDRYGTVLLPIFAELALVMAVVGLHRPGCGRRHGLRSGCGGSDGRRTIRTRRTRGPAGERRGSGGGVGGPDGE
ncbi:signal peptidase I [Streptomyces finlayi]|uniref:Signal peptidase I n=1 Tax=Streptomyces finlayi TaxID=67296 RepID=A0A7G7BH71_9ACTN|nr:signal peptidase I [Streptomyces finlayi]QNE74686.1 signal peptidase I [Streptomyces finlayi]